MKKSFIVFLLGALILLLLVLGIGLSRRTSLVQNNTPVSDVSQTVLDFYNNYQNCMQHPLAKASGHVSTYCQSHNVYGATDLVANLEKGGAANSGIDPIFCSQNPSPALSVKDPGISGNKATAKAIFTYDSLPSLVIVVTLSQESNSWKVSDISCP